MKVIVIKIFCFAVAEKEYCYGQINYNPGYALSCFKGLVSEEEKKKGNKNFLLLECHQGQDSD